MLPKSERRRRRKCPTPGKTAFPDRGIAEKKLALAGAPMRVYKCPCGAWHWTSQLPRIPRRALNEHRILAARRALELGLRDVIEAARLVAPVTARMTVTDENTGSQTA